MNHDLRQQIESLRAELRQIDSIESGSRALLLTLVGDIARLLERSENATPKATPGSAAIERTASEPSQRSDAPLARQDAQSPDSLSVRSESLSNRLDELAVQFEAEHPGLGTALRRVVDALGKAGI